MVLSLALSPSPLAGRNTPATPGLTSGPLPDPVGERAALLIRRYASPGEKLVVWVWTPRYYVLAGMPGKASAITTRPSN